jgi:isopenicillin-N epimerase
MMKNFADQFLLNPEITFLNAGSFGACPKPIFDDYQHWQRLLEHEPVQFIKFNSIGFLENSRKALGAYVGANADDLVYVPNPSFAVNIVAKSFPLQANDEVLSTNLEYGACDKTWEYYCNKAGAKYIKQSIHLPIESKENFLADFFAGVNANTKLIFISHITSSTALIFPVKEICAMAQQKGIPVFVDGAHAPGHVALDIESLGADIYTGACHKWMMTPKGSSFLYVKKAMQPLFDPLVVSWGYNSATPSHSQFLDYHQMQGTRDVSAFLTIPKSIEFMQQNHWWNVAADCKKIVLQQAPRFLALCNAAAICPMDAEWIGQMFCIPIQCASPMELEKYLYSKYNITIPIMPHGNYVFMRYSFASFNTESDLDTLYNALKESIAEGIYMHV